MTRSERDGGGAAALEGGDLRAAMKRLTKGPMHFAFGIDEKRKPVMLMHRTKTAKALRQELKTKLGIKRSTHGKASANGKVLELEVEGPAIPTMDKDVKLLLRREKIATFTKAVVLQLGADEAAPHEEAPDAAAGDTLNDELRDLRAQLEALEARAGEALRRLAAGETDDASLLEEYVARCVDFAKRARGCRDQELLAFAKGRVERARKMADFVSRATAGGGSATAPASTAPAAPPARDTSRSQLSGSVGKGGKNAPDDVRTVQTLLNEHGAGLEVDGAVGPKTVRAIGVFQKENLGFVDGRVDPGGKTWLSLSGGAAKVRPGGPADSGGGGGDGGAGDGGEDGGGAPAPPSVHREPVSDEFDDERADDRRPGDGAWFDAETEVKTPFGSVKVQTDASGRVTGGSLSRNVVPTVGFKQNFAGPYYAGIDVKFLEEEVSFTGTGPIVPVTGKIGCGGSGVLGIGAAKEDFTIGLQGEVALSVYTEVFKAEVDIDQLRFAFDGPKFPLQIPLKGEIKAGAVIEVQEWGVSHTIPVREYDKLVIAEISADFGVTVKKGPGLDKLGADLDDLYRLALDAVEKARRDPSLVGTGPKPLGPGDFEGLGGGEEPQKAQSAAGDIDRIAKEAAQQADRMEAIQTLRQIEASMRSAFQAGWNDPTLLGKANALAQKDEARAREIYGQAWTQRALAKQAHDQYSSPLDSTPLDIVAARTAQAHDIAQKFQTVVALFRQGDSAW